jgi:hypothetical protein
MTTLWGLRVRGGSGAGTDDQRLAACRVLSLQRA